MVVCVGGLVDLNLSLHLFSAGRYELKGAKYIEKLPAGKHSTKGLGRTAPDPEGLKTRDDGVAVPMGKALPSVVSNSALLYNEYPVGVMGHGR